VSLDGKVRRTRISPRKLLLSKWTAVSPERREKHFLVVRVLSPDPPESAVSRIDLEAVLSRRVMSLHWRELTDPSLWKQGWL